MTRWGALRGLFLFWIAIQSGRLYAEKFSKEAFLQNPVGTSRDLASVINSPTLTPQACSLLISEVATSMKQLSPREFHPHWMNMYQPMGRYHPDIWIPATVKNLQAAKVGLSRQFRRFYFENGGREIRADDYRLLLRLLRYADESLSYLHYFVLKNPPDHPVVQIHSDAEILKSPDPTQIESYFRDGDWVLTRSVASLSGAIARMPENKDSQASDMDSQFSHLAMLASDAKGTRVTLEAQLQNGVNIHSILEFMNKKERARAALYRSIVDDLPQYAAQIGYRMIDDRARSGQPPFRYTFKGVFDPEGEEMFCSGMAKCFYLKAVQALGLATPELPIFPSRYNLKDPWILKKFGIQPGQETFAPGDVEVEPSFRFVMEWRDLERTYRANLADIISTEVYRRLDEGYRFIPDLKAKFTTEVLLRMRRGPQVIWSWWPDKLKNAFPPYIDRDALEVMTMMVGVSDRLRDELLRLDQLYIREHKVPMGWSELEKAVRQILDQDPWVSKRFRPL